MTKFCCANTILSPPTPPEENLVKHRLAENSESASGCHRGSEKEGGEGFVTRRVTTPPPLFLPPKNSAHFSKTRCRIAQFFLFSNFSPEKVAHHVHNAEMKATARYPDGSRAPRAPLVSRETQGTLSPLSFDRQNETRVPPGTLRFHFTPKPVLK